MIEGNLSPEIGAPDGGWGLTNFDGNIEDFEDAAESHAAGEKIGVRAEHYLHGAEQPKVVGHEIATRPPRVR